MRDILKDYRADENNPKWKNIVSRQKSLYKRDEDLRSEFERDYTRVIHSNSYRRMKHKTQVIFSPENDHICTRTEHVTHVESISYTIAKYLGLNTELTKAIATAHDIGHSPFGHQGERILSAISQRDLSKKFWHDKIEVLEDTHGDFQNLNLTYATRDGIISHCGEIDENYLRPREEFIDLNEYKEPNQYAPYTWEGCVVKIADKISYLGRDIEDAITLGILDDHLEELHQILEEAPTQVINNTVIINTLIRDLCENSSYEKGLCFSKEIFDWINKLKKFNYKYIYMSPKVRKAIPYFELIINTIYETLIEAFDGKNTDNNLEKMSKQYPELIASFREWMARYWNLERPVNYKNDVIFNMENKSDFSNAIIYYISGMTDNFAIETYNKIIRF